MNKVFFSLLLLVLFSASAVAQSSLKVMTVSGQVEAKSGAKLTPGQSVAASNSLVVKPGGYLSLMNAEGKTIEIKKPGTYTVASLSQQIGQQKASSLSERYASYVYSKLTDNFDEDKDVEENYQKYMDITGSVERGDLFGSGLQLHVPTSTDVLPGTNIIYWTSPKKYSSYTVTIYNMFEQKIWSKSISGNMLEISIEEIAEAARKSNTIDDGTYLVSVQADKDSKMMSDKHALKAMRGSKSVALQQQRDALTAELPSDNSVSHLIMAGFYEQNGLYLDALKSYHEAVALNPDVKEYGELLYRYLKKMGVTASTASN